MNPVKKMKKMKKKNDFLRFVECGHDILSHPIYQRQKQFIQHGNITLFEHSVSVAFLAFKLSESLSLNTKNVVRGALLHDFFLYDWHEEGKRMKKTLFKKHGFKHASYALENASFYFPLNAMEKDIISKHMFPLNVKPPIYIESWIVNISDDVITYKESMKQAVLNEEIFKFIEAYFKGK